MPPCSARDERDGAWLVLAHHRVEDIVRDGRVFAGGPQRLALLRGALEKVVDDEVLCAVGSPCVAGTRLVDRIAGVSPDLVGSLGELGFARGSHDIGRADPSGLLVSETGACVPSFEVVVRGRVLGEVVALTDEEETRGCSGGDSAADEGTMVG